MDNVHKMVKNDQSSTTCNQILSPGDIAHEVTKKYKLKADNPISIRQGKNNWIVVNTFAQYKQS